MIIYAILLKKVKKIKKIKNKFKIYIYYISYLYLYKNKFKFNFFNKHKLFNFKSAHRASIIFFEPSKTTFPMEHMSTR